MKPHKHAELIKAWADGAEIQVYNGYEWVRCSPVWDTSLKYRIKPEREYPKSSLTGDELNALWSPTLISSTLRDSLRDVADAAVKRYIQDQS